MKWQVVCCVRVKEEKIVSCVLDRQFDTEEAAETFVDNYYADIRDMVAEWEVANSEDIIMIPSVAPVMELF